MKDPDTKRRYAETLLAAASKGCLWSLSALASQARVSAQAVYKLSHGKTQALHETTACALTRTTLRHLDGEIRCRMTEIKELQRYRDELKDAHADLYGLRGDGTC